MEFICERKYSQQLKHPLGLIKQIIYLSTNLMVELLRTFKWFGLWFQLSITSSKSSNIKPKTLKK